MITGKNIGLRAVEKEDLPYLRDWRNIPNFRKHFREVRELSLTDQEAWFESLQKTKHINYMFTIVDLKTNRPIGAGGILYINWIIRSGDFSFYIGEDEMYIGNDGKAKEAAELLIDYGFKNLNLHKIWMELYEFDTQKIDFFKNYFDFKQDGLLRDNCFENGRYWNSLIISLISKNN
ncbi:GNAT family N-acetyltransferase [Tenacibaculum maritimum]|uniref:GNAT family N-acetyltransferase n=8 Tax=Tenacibaculum maritimum TaxID=107401 RepID=UPI0010A43643|nr:GNAT family protein [Tenacibaculum maritimum]MCD9563142.1 GNAT family N-acetyltransferase [Tenacibaculum maritimum]MCD9565465.1 GNAT family N-acetyltransferase [Tenacibaculum maritimum]MCD9578077.1 GNAT family N-acetyltransferase [Tenacibaculum maritimum]MCD9585289.1 GNAT family N-acetyltransferase [Tenacibaculum maritimum]MCD9596019.1 GNAT family N-acetyltransferase [Tenacibaculum maritimum]